MNPKKITVWRNPTRIAPRTDAEIVYADGTRERVLSVPDGAMAAIEGIVRGGKSLKEGK